jgi:two-component system chemotaxis sensor kinase CheA
MDDLLREFLTETGEHLDTVDRELVRFEQCSGDQAILRNIFRLVHTIKGTCGFLGLPRLETLAHAAENLMGRLRDGMPLTSEAVTAILLTVDRIKLILAEIDRLNAEPPGNDADLIAQLDEVTLSDDSGAIPEAASSLPVEPAPPPVAPGPIELEPLEDSVPDAPASLQGAVLDLPAEPGSADGDPGARAEADEKGSRRASTIRVGVDTIEHLMTMVSELVLTRNQLLEIGRRADVSESYKVPLQRLSHVTAELQESVMKARMQPIGNAWAKLPRLLRDLAPDLGKKIELVMRGAETELDRQLLEVIRDPLTHMVRNSADHGIESTAERLAAGKPAHGTIRLNAFHEGGAITIEIGDDGRGLNHAAIARQALATGMATEAEIARMGEEQIAQFIFRPGFSTSQTVTSISGRGVGMDVVRTNIDAIGGTIGITSTRGRGTLFTIKIPLTLAIVASLIVGIGGQRFALPQTAVLELIRVRDGSEHRLERLNGTPVLRLRDELLPVLEGAKLLSLKSGDDEATSGFVVVLLVGARRFGLMVDAVLESEEIVVKPMSAKLRQLPLFSGNTILGDGAVVLIIDPNGVARQIGPEALRSVADLAISAPKRRDHGETLTLLVFRAGGPSLKAVPLSLVTRLEEVDAATIERIGDRPCLQYRGRLMPLVTVWSGAVRTTGPQSLIVFSEPGRSVALAVDEIVDIVEEDISIAPVTDRPDLVGSAIIRGRATEIVDVAGIVPWFGEDAAGGSGHLAKTTVLLVDDKAFFRDMLSPVLKAAGYRVRTAAHVDEALQVLASAPIDAIVTDLDMPGRSGLQLIEEVRRQPRLADLPVIALASAASSAVLDHARELDVFDVVAKFDRTGLISALAEIGSPSFEQAA